VVGSTPTPKRRLIRSHSHFITAEGLGVGDSESGRGDFSIYLKPETAIMRNALARGCVGPTRFANLGGEKQLTVHNRSQNLNHQRANRSHGQRRWQFGDALIDEIKAILEEIGMR
jgi:hypothetical protein